MNTRGWTQTTVSLLLTSILLTSIILTNENSTFKKLGMLTRDIIVIFEYQSCYWIEIDKVLKHKYSILMNYYLNLEIN